MNQISLPIFSLLLLIALAGCGGTTANLPERSRLECPVPPVVCKPGRFDRITLDTSSTPGGRSGYYLHISQVEGLNDEPDEFGIAFTPRGNFHEGLATIRARSGRFPAGHDSLLQVTLPHPTEADIGNRITAEGLQSGLGRGVEAAQGDTIYFATRLAGRVMGDYDLFVGSLGDYRIRSPRRTPLSSITSWEAQPALSPDGGSLYFASDRRGGLGGTDIYVSHRDGDGRWSEPQNLGTGINTTCDELSPWVSGDGRWLYFSSSGHETVGGYDLFRAPIAGIQVGGAENLGRPINTPDDEIFPSAPANANPDTLLYYSSNQTGSKGFDVYVLHRLKRRTLATTTPSSPQKTTLSGTVRNGRGVPVADADVTLEQRDPPGGKETTSTSPSGHYEFEVERGKKYEVTAESKNTLYGREEVVIPMSGDVPSHDISLPDTITFRVNFPFNNATDPYEFTLDDRGLPTSVRWADMIERAADFLKRFGGSSGTGFEIVGHTDPLGTDQFNLDLGRRRAEFIRGELVKRGVDPATLSVRSEGESRPLAMHTDESDELYRARLRRVELFRK